jgi:hypothetical protein
MRGNSQTAKQPYARSSPSTPPPLLLRQSPGAKGGQAFYRYRELSCVKARGRRGAKRFFASANSPASKPGGEGGPSVLSLSRTFLCQSPVAKGDQADGSEE